MDVYQPNTYSTQPCDGCKFEQNNTYIVNQYDSKKSCQKKQPVYRCSTKIKIINQSRTLWEQHVFWTRMTIQSIAFENPDLEATSTRLLRNPSDFGKFLEPYYGKRITRKFVDLFTQHLVIAAQLVVAVKNKNAQGIRQARKRWEENAEDIARFLDNINRFWTYREWIKLLNEHLKMTEVEAIQILSGDYQGSVTTFDRIEKQALEMADLMAKGIRRQFIHQCH